MIVFNSTFLNETGKDSPVKTCWVGFWIYQGIFGRLIWTAVYWAREAGLSWVTENTAKEKQKQRWTWVRNISLWFYVLSYIICIRTNNVQQFIHCHSSLTMAAAEGRHRSVVSETLSQHRISHIRGVAAYCKNQLYLSQLPVQSLKLVELPGDGPADVLAVVIFRKAHIDKVTRHLLSILLRGLRDTHTDFNSYFHSFWFTLCSD